MAIQTKNGIEIGNNNNSVIYVGEHIREYELSLLSYSDYWIVLVVCLFCCFWIKVQNW